MKNKKSTMKKILYNILLLAIISISNVSAQDDLILKQQLRGKDNLTDIMNVVTAYYKDPANINRLGISSVNRAVKHWQRFEWFMSNRLGLNGEFVNINEKMILATGVQQNRKLSTGANFGEGSQITAGNWALVGPNTTDNGIGRIDRLAFHPTDANTVYAGAAGGGLWRTTNAGTSWTNLTSDIPCLGISGIAIDYNSTNTIYILTGDGDSNISGGLVNDFGYMRFSIGVLKSTNGGGTWIKTGNFPGANYSTLVGFRLTIHPTNPNILFACTSQGIYRTTDGGNNWTLVENRGRFFNLKFKPGSSQVCYAVSMHGNTSKFFKSTDGGINFSDNSTINNQINNPTDRADLAVGQSNSSVVYLLAGGVFKVGSNRFKGLFRSSDSGDSFTFQTNSPNILGRATDGLDTATQSIYDLTIAVSNNTSNTVAVGAIQVWRSLDAGVAWDYRGSLHDDVHELGFHPVDNKLWAATDGGVYSSTNNGQDWTSHFDGMCISQFYRIAVSPDNYLDMIGGLQDNGIKQRTTGNSNFFEINGADGFSVAYDDADPTVYYGIANQGVRRFTGSGANTAGITWPNSSLPFAASMAASTSQGNTIFVGESNFWRNSTASNPGSWVQSPNILGGWFMRTCPSNGSRIYMAGGNSYQSTSGVLRRSDDAGVTWSNGNILSNNNNFPNPYPKITSINVDPVNSNWVWVTFGGYNADVKVYFSNDAGVNWFNRSGSLPNLPVNCIALDNNNNAYAGTDNGVYYRGSGMNDWVPFYNDLPYVPVSDLVISESNNRIRAATFGRGIWASELYSACPAILNVTGTLEGQKFYEASNSLSSTASIQASEGSKVQMRGGNEVLLTDGFTAKENTQFKAMIGPCGSGGVAGYFANLNDTTALLPPAQYLSPADGKKALIHIESVLENTANVLITQRGEGFADIVLTNEHGKIISTKHISAAKTGTWTESVFLDGLKKGMYFLQILINKRVEHLQELVIK